MNRWLAAHVFWPLSERLCGRDTMHRYRKLLQTQHASADALRALQDRKLRRLLRSAAAHCPFYARRFDAADLDVNAPNLSADDLQGLPTLDRTQIRENLDTLTWRACPGGVKPFNTGGSTGEPLQFHVDRFRTSADAAARLRSRTWWGVWPGDVEILLWGAPIELKADDRIRRQRDRMLNQTILNAFDMTSESMGAYLARIEAARPVCLYGYPSSIALLARYARDRCTTLPVPGTDRLRAVFVTGEVLTDADGDAITQAFGAPVAIEYGSRDGGLTALACEAGRLHIQAENTIVELLDENDRPVGPGQVGEVTLTHLETIGMPIIRYRNGDLARWPDAGDAWNQPVCTCGRSLPVLAEVRGRVTDQIVCRTAVGLRRMHALSLIYVLREIEGLTQFRITQPTLDRLDVAVVADGRFTPQSQARIEQGLSRRMGEGVSIAVRRCDRIPPTASGKHACVVSDVKLEQA
jgi:phenylacetate-CoA ligase